MSQINNANKNKVVKPAEDDGKTMKHERFHVNYLKT